MFVYKRRLPAAFCKSTLLHFVFARPSSRPKSGIPIYIKGDSDNYYSEHEKLVGVIQANMGAWSGSRDNIIVTFDDGFCIRHQSDANAVKWLLLAMAQDRDVQTIAVHGNQPDQIEAIVVSCERIALARLLAALPSNIATPKALATHFHKMFEGVPNVKRKTWGPKQLEKDGFGLITAIGQSAGMGNRGPRMFLATRKGAKNGYNICIIGKGVTFDAGGTAIKPFNSMKMMKYDKLGAVYAAYAGHALMADPSFKKHTISVILPLAENTLSENAVLPGDVARGYNGKTVEIVNPDAEGRLLIADALGYASKHLHPDMVLDVATLTGHAQTVNCFHNGVFYTANKKLGAAIETLTYDIGERMIEMPAWTDVPRNVLESQVADISNSGAKCNDSFTASMFLREFVPSDARDWLHIDLAHELSGVLPTGKGLDTVIEAIRLWASMFQKMT